MSFLDKAEEGAVESGNNDGDGGSGQDEDYGIDVDFDETPFIRAAPTTFPTGVFPEQDEGNPIIRFKNAEYNNGRLDQGYLGLVVDEPEAVVDEDEGTASTVILETNDADSTDFRLFNEDDDETKVIDGMGVKFGDRLYEGEFVDELPDTRSILTVSGASAKNVAKRLDSKGAVIADMDPEEGGTNGGLIEYKPSEMREGDSNEVTSRYARDPELKGSLFGQRLGVFLARREELDNEDTGYGDEHDDPDKASFAELVADGDRPERGMYWYVVFDVDAEEEVEAEDTDTEVRGYTYLHDDWGGFDPSVGGIPDDQWEFVEEYVEAAESGDVDTDEENIRANINENSDEFNASPEVDSMVNAITNRV